MEVLILALLGICIYLLKSKHDSNAESKRLSEIVEIMIRENSQEVEDHKAAELELRLIKTKLETIQESALTPDNAVPKDMHVEKVVELSTRLTSMQSELKHVTEKFEESRGKQISERVRLGAIGENFAAFHESFPYNRKSTKALFQPVDLICFEDDEVVFIDVKTGNSQLSTKQRNIRDNIKAGRCRFEVHRLDENGYKIESCPKSKVYVKYPDNFSDWIKQKKRSTGGYNQIKSLIGVEIRSFKKESFGVFGLFKFVSNLREFFWLFMLFFARLYLWFLIYIDINIRKRSHKEIWVRIKSTK